MDIEKRFIAENLKRFEVKEFLEKELSRAGIGDIQIQRTPIGTRVIVYAQRPALIIGRRGSIVRRLTNILREKFNLDNPTIEVQDIDVPELNPKIMANYIARAIERGVHFRRVAYSALRRIMEAGAIGAEIRISGKLTGERAKAVKFTQGFLKKCGDPAQRYVRVAYATAIPKPGVIGIQVRILPPGAIIPDDIKIKDVKELEEIKEEEIELEEVEEAKEEIKEEKKEEKGG